MEENGLQVCRPPSAGVGRQLSLKWLLECGNPTEAVAPGQYECICKILAAGQRKPEVLAIKQRPALASVGRHYCGFPLSILYLYSSLEGLLAIGIGLR